MINNRESLSNDPKFLDHWCSSSFDDRYSNVDTNMMEGLLSFQECKAEISPVLLDNVVYHVLIYPFECESCPPHLHLHIHYTDYSNDLCVGLDKPEYFWHDSDHQLILPYPFHINKYKADDSEPKHRLSACQTLILDNHLRSSYVDNVSCWDYLVMVWNHNNPDNRVHIDEIPNYCNLN